MTNLVEPQKNFNRNKYYAKLKIDNKRNGINLRKDFVYNSSFRYIIYFLFTNYQHCFFLFFSQTLIDNKVYTVFHTPLPRPPFQPVILSPGYTLNSSLTSALSLIQDGVAFVLNRGIGLKLPLYTIPPYFGRQKITRCLTNMFSH